MSDADWATELVAVMAFGRFPQPLDGFRDRRAQPFGRRAHRRDVRHGALGNERRFRRLALGDRRHARELPRGVVHHLDAVAHAQEHRSHHTVESPDGILQRLAPLLDRFRGKDVRAQSIALLQRALQHHDRTRDVADLVLTFGARDLRLPVAARHRDDGLGDPRQRPGDAADAHSMIRRRTAPARQPPTTISQPDQRPALHLADTDQFVTQRYAARRWRASEQTRQDRTNLRNVPSTGRRSSAAVWSPARLQRSSIAVRSRPRRSADRQPNIATGALRARKTLRVSARSGFRVRCPIKSGEHVAEIVENRLDRRPRRAGRFAGCRSRSRGRRARSRRSCAGRVGRLRSLSSSIGRISLANGCAASAWLVAKMSITSILRAARVQRLLVSAHGSFEVDHQDSIDDRPIAPRGRAVH